VWKIWVLVTSAKGSVSETSVCLYQPARIFLNCGKLQNRNVTVTIYHSLIR